MIHVTRRNDTAVKQGSLTFIQCLLRATPSNPPSNHRQPPSPPKHCAFPKNISTVSDETIVAGRGKIIYENWNIDQRPMLIISIFPL